jgi:hypothetical protein
MRGLRIRSGALDEDRGLAALLFALQGAYELRARAREVRRIRGKGAVRIPRGAAGGWVRLWLDRPLESVVSGGEKSARFGGLKRAV